MKRQALIYRDHEWVMERADIYREGGEPYPLSPLDPPLPTPANKSLMKKFHAAIAKRAKARPEMVGEVSGEEYEIVSRPSSG